MIGKIGLAVSLATVAALAPSIQMDVVPEAVWVQYPLVLIFAATAVWIAKYWLQNEREWRRDLMELINSRDERHRQELQHLTDEMLERQIDIITKIYYQETRHK